MKIILIDPKSKGQTQASILENFAEDCIFSLNFGGRGGREGEGGGPLSRAGFSLRGAPDPKVLAGPLYMGGEILRGKSLFQSPNAFSSPVFRG